MTICFSEIKVGTGEKKTFMSTGERNGNFEGEGVGVNKCTIGEGNRRKGAFILHGYRGTKAKFEGGSEHMQYWGTRKA